MPTLHHGRTSYRLIWIWLVLTISCQPTLPNPPKQITHLEQTEARRQSTPLTTISPCEPLAPGEPIRIQGVDPDAQIYIDCSTSNCGGNSPIVNRFPINGLNSGGCENSQHVKLVPGSVHFPTGTSSPCEGKTLDVDGAGHLFAGDEHLCAETALNGASFEIEKDGKSYPIFIKYHGAVTNYSKQSISGYIFRWEDNKGKSLCDTETSYKVQSDLHLLNKRDSSWDVLDSLYKFSQATSATSNERDDVLDSDIAIVFPSEIRGENSEVLAKSNQPGWFNIACRRDALAKIDLDIIAPHQKQPVSDSKYYDKRTTALKMFTANYCQTSRYTYEGNEIKWTRRNGARWYRRDGETISNDYQLEAEWNKDGAVCLKNTRLYSRFRSGTIPEKTIPKKCFVDNKNVCDSEAKFRSALWEECPRTTEPCRSPPKNPTYFQSYSHR